MIIIIKPAFDVQQSRTCNSRICILVVLHEMPVCVVLLSILLYFVHKKELQRVPINTMHGEIANYLKS